MPREVFTPGPDDLPPPLPRRSARPAHSAVSLEEEGPPPSRLRRGDHSYEHPLGVTDDQPPWEAALPGLPDVPKLPSARQNSEETDLLRLPTGRTRRWIAGLALAGTITGAIIGVLSLKGDQNGGREKGERPAATARPLSEAEPQYSSVEERTYAESRAEVFNTPFEAVFLTDSERTQLTEARIEENRLLVESLDARTPEYYAGDPAALRAFNEAQQRLEESRREVERLEAGLGDKEQAEKDQVRIEAELAHYQAEFLTAVQLSSGIKINFYRSLLEDPGEPLKIDERALDVLINRLMFEMANEENSPVANDMEQIRRQAANGQVDLLLSMIVVSDESLCITGEEGEGGSITNTSLEERWVTQGCRAIGLNSRSQIPGQRALNQLLVVLDSGQWSAREDYPDRLKEVGPFTPNQTFAITAAHETAHALTGLTLRNGLLEMDQEHAQIVNPAEADMAEYVWSCSLNRERERGEIPGNSRSRYVLPAHVDNSPAASLTG